MSSLADELLADFGDDDGSESSINAPERHTTTDSKPASAAAASASSSSAAPEIKTEDQDTEPTAADLAAAMAVDQTANDDVVDPRLLDKLKAGEDLKNITKLLHSDHLQTLLKEIE